MLIKSKHRLLGNYGQLEVGQIADLPRWQAIPLIALGYVDEVMEAIDGGHEDTKAASGQLHRRRRGKSKPGAGP